MQAAPDRGPAALRQLAADKLLAAATARKIAGVSLQNRLAVAPMTRVSASAQGLPTPAMAEYYQRFAQGGFGLVLSEGLYTDCAFSQG